MRRVAVVGTQEVGPDPQLVPRAGVVPAWQGVIVVLGVDLMGGGELLQPGQAGDPARGAAGLGEDGEQECCQEDQDRDHYQQLDQGEASLSHSPHLGSSFL